MRFIWGVALISLWAAGSTHAYVTGGGTTAIQFRRPLLADMGLVLTNETPTAPSARAGAVTFVVMDGPGLAFRAPRGDLETFDQGALQHMGGFTLKGNDLVLSLENFNIRAVPGTDQFVIPDASGALLFRLSHVHGKFLPEHAELFLKDMDLTVTEELAARLGHPEFADITIGVVDIRVGVEK